MGACLQMAAHWLMPHLAVTATIVALAFVLAISFGFELFSLLTGWGRYDFYDAIASIIGGVLGMGLVFWIGGKIALPKLGALMTEFQTALS